MRSLRVPVLMAVTVLGLVSTSTAAVAGPGTGPDLAVTSLAVPTTVTAGQPVTVGLTITNSGNRSARRSVTRIVLSRDTRAGRGDLVLANLGTKKLRAAKPR